MTLWQRVGGSQVASCICWHVLIRHALPTLTRLWGTGRDYACLTWGVVVGCRLRVWRSVVPRSWGLISRVLRCTLRPALPASTAIWSRSLCVGGLKLFPLPIRALTLCGVLTCWSIFLICPRL